MPQQTWTVTAPDGTQLDVSGERVPSAGELNAIFEQHARNTAGGGKERSEWGRRADGSLKGNGFLGVLSRPDGKVSSELSIGVNLGGKEVEIPTLVPTLTPSEVQYLLSNDASQGAGSIPRPIIDKAVAFARQRQAQGKPYFAETGEQQPNLYPQFQRAGEEPLKAPSDRPARGAALGGVLGSLLSAAMQVHPLGRLAAAAGGGLFGAMAGGADPLSAVGDAAEQGLYEVPGIGLEQFARAGRAGGEALYRKSFGPVPMKAVQKSPAYMSTGSTSAGEQQILQDAMRRRLVLNDQAVPRMTGERQGLGNQVGQEIRNLPTVSPQAVLSNAQRRVQQTVGTQLAPGRELSAARAKIGEFAQNPRVTELVPGPQVPGGEVRVQGEGGTYRWEPGMVDGPPVRQFRESVPAVSLHKLKVQTGRRLKAAVGSPEAVAPGTEGNRALFQAAQEQLPITPELSDQYGRAKALETAVKLRRPSSGPQPYMGVSILSGSPFGGISPGHGSGWAPLKLIQLSDFLKARLPLGVPQAIRGGMLMGNEQ